MQTWLVMMGISVGVLQPSLPTQARKAPGTPVAVVVQLYQDYAWEVVVHNPNSRTGLMDEPLDVLARYFDDRLTQLIVRDRECRVRTREVCNISGLPIWDSNDPEAFDLAVVATKDSTLVAVSFRRRYPESDGTTVRLSYRMVKTARGWRVQDIIRVDGGSLVKSLTAG